MSTYAAVPEGTAPGGLSSPRDEGVPSKYTQQINEEYHDPFDDWSSRDILLSLVPLIIVYAFQDVAFHAGLIVALAFSVFLLLICRTVLWDSKKKTVWPLLDIINVILWTVLLGTSYRWQNTINRWFNVIAPATFATAIAMSIMWRRAFSAHYARYPKFDRGGRHLWDHDPVWRRTADISAINWWFAFAVATLLPLIPILTGHARGPGPLNTIFNYIVPLLCLLFGLIQHQVLGHTYTKRALHDKDVQFGAAGGHGTTGSGVEPYPAGAPGQAPTATAV